MYIKLLNINTYPFKLCIMNCSHTITKAACLHHEVSCIRDDQNLTSKRCCFCYGQLRQTYAVFTGDTFTRGKLTLLLYYVRYCEMTFTSRKRVSCKHDISVDGRRKRIVKYAFSNEKVLCGRGQNQYTPMYRTPATVYTFPSPDRVISWCHLRSVSWCCLLS